MAELVDAVGLGPIGVILTGSIPVLSKYISTGWVAEWSNASDCKSLPNGTLVRVQPHSKNNGDVAQLVERVLCKD